MFIFKANFYNADEIQKEEECRCGPNAVCNENKVCSCIDDYHGDPYIGCRPECILNSDCARDKACIRNKCTNSCSGICGQNALCEVFNHIPICQCPAGMSGNAFIACNPVQSKRIHFSFYTHIIFIFNLL